MGKDSKSLRAQLGLIVHPLQPLHAAGRELFHGGRVARKTARILGTPFTSGGGL